MIKDYYNYKDTDEIFLRVFDKYKEGYNACNDFGDKHLNLFGIIFHELMYYTCSLIFLKLTESLKDNSLLNTNSINNNIKNFGDRFIGKNRWFNYDLSAKEKLAKTLLRLDIRSNKIIGMCGLEYREFIPKFIKENLKIKIYGWNKFPYIQNLNSQLDILKGIINELSKDYEIKREMSVIIKALENTLQNNPLKTNKKLKINSLIVGALGIFNNRILAGLALSQGIPVYALAHGNECGVADVPSWGFNERTYCSDFIGYGFGGNQEINGGRYLTPLHKSQPNYLQTNCDTILNIHKISNRLINFSSKDIQNLKILYIPCKYLGINRIGPFHSIPDEHYFLWQKELFGYYKNLTLKIHPKMHTQKNLINFFPKRESGYLETVYHKYDLFMIDNVTTTAFANIAATSKPIIYFNIGMGNLTPLAQKLIKQRALCIDINYKRNVKEQLDCIKRISEEKYINDFTSTFSIDIDNQKRINQIYNHVSERKT